VREKREFGPILAQKRGEKQQRTASVTTAVLFFIGIADGDATLASPRKLREYKEREEKDWINAEDIFVFFFF
jgi:NTP pyrophosphatase (non-canonical NTP hydrolase)